MNIKYKIKILKKIVTLKEIKLGNEAYVICIFL